jgi:hypothetical protein
MSREQVAAAQGSDTALEDAMLNKRNSTVADGRTALVISGGLAL